MSKFLDSFLCPDLAKPGDVLFKPSEGTPLACAGFLIKPRFQKEDDVATTLVLAGFVRDLEQSERVGAEWTARPGKMGITALQAGTIIGLSFTLNRPPTAGSITLYAHKNGIQQNSAGHFLTATTSQANALAFTTPIPFVAGDVLDAGVFVDGSFTPEGSDGLIGLWITQPTP